MNKEIHEIIYMASGGILFALGGTGDWKFATKAWRRYGFPIITFFYILHNPCDIYMASLVAGLLCGILHLGYGSNHKWPGRIAVAASFSIPSIFIHLTIWQIILPIWFILFFKLSNTKSFQSQVRWKMVEFTTGVLIAVTFL